VRLHARPETGEGVLVGDAVNTCARLLGEAPPMGVVAGEMTQRLSARAIAYEELPAITAKGKKKPVRRWLARGHTARRGQEARMSFATPMVGREVELASLDALLAKAIASSSPQFVLVSGEAGMGKSRLVGEFFRLIDERPDFFVQWRQGRCPPYGDELSYWVLREIAAAHAGILRTDDPAVVEQKLAAVLQGRRDSERVGARLRALLGLSASQADRDDTFAAWRTFLEGIAEQLPAVIVMEDIHWASEPTLAFLDHVVRHAAGVPLLLVATARPEFLDAGAVPLTSADKIVHLALKALSPDDSARLARQLPLVADSDELALAVARQSGGNPLFAEELAWVMGEHPDSTDPAAGEAVGLDTIAALLGARLDALPREQRAVLADASVIGNVFWPSAAASVGGLAPEEVKIALEHIESRELVRRHAESTYSPEPEYEFWHALMRDVAYQRMPRLDRCARHSAAADWIEGSQRTAVADAADLIAHHRTVALELAQAAGREDIAGELRPRAVLALRRSGERMLSSDILVAEREFERAVVVAGQDDPERPSLLRAWAGALLQSGKLRQAAAVFEEAADGHRRAGEMTLAALAEASGWYSLSLMGEKSSGLPDVPDLLLTSEEPGQDLAGVLELGADRALYACRSALALDLAGRAAQVLEQLSLPSLRARELRSIALCQLGRREGLEEYRTVIAKLRSDGESHWTCTAMSNLAELLLAFEGTGPAGELQDEAIDMATRLNDHLAGAFTRFLRLQVHYWSGEWTTAMRDFAEIERLLEERDDMWDLRDLRAFGALLHLHRGDTRTAERLAAWAEEQSRGTPIVGIRAACLVALSAVLARRGDEQQAGRHLEELREVLALADGLETDIVLLLPEALRTTRLLGWPEAGAGFIEAALRTRPFDSGTRAYLEGLRCERLGDAGGGAERFDEAAAIWDGLGFRFESAQSKLGSARCRAALGDTAAAGASARAAFVAFRELGALPAMSEADAIVTQEGRRAPT
jgi:tetratricopeptide (TPR) repeat protein